jgi:hypothetical protein
MGFAVRRALVLLALPPCVVRFMFVTGWPAAAFAADRKTLQVIIGPRCNARIGLFFVVLPLKCGVRIQTHWKVQRLLRGQRPAEVPTEFLGSREIRRLRRIWLMLQRLSPDGFIVPCQPSLSQKPPTGPRLIHEIKRSSIDFRIIAHRQGDGVCLWTRNANDWPATLVTIVAAIRRRFRCTSCPDLKLSGRS